jgi:hypothetical protein
LRPSRSCFRSYRVLLLIAFVLVGAVAPAEASSFPVQPNPYSVASHQALGLANTTTQSTVASLTFAFNVTFAVTSCGANCWAVQTGSGIISSPTSWGATFLSASTTVSPIHAPPFGNPQILLSCDGQQVPYQVVSSLTIQDPCLVLTFEWNAAHYDSEDSFAVSYLITHIVTVRYIAPVKWPAATPCTLLNVSLFIPGSKQWFSSYVTQAWNVTSVTYGVGLPQGNWNLAATTLYDTNSSQYYPSNFFSVTERSFLVQWTNYPSVTQPGTIGSHGDPINRALRIVTCLVTGSGGTSNQTVPNGTVPPSPPVFPSSITLTLGTFQLTSAGNYTASAQWTNNLTAPFSGEFVLTAAWVAQVGYASVFENGNLLPQSEFSVTNTSVVVYPSAVTILNGSAVQFTVDFAVAPTYTFTSALFYLNGAPLTTTDAYFLAVGAIVATLVVLRVSRYKFAGLDLILAFALSASAVGFVLGVQ